MMTFTDDQLLTLRQFMTDSVDTFADAADFDSERDGDYREMEDRAREYVRMIDDHRRSLGLTNDRVETFTTKIFNEVFECSMVIPNDDDGTITVSTMLRGTRFEQGFGGFTHDQVRTMFTNSIQSVLRYR